MFWRQTVSHDPRAWLGWCQALLVCAFAVASLTMNSAAPALAYDDRQNLGRGGDGDDEAVLGTFHLRGPDRVGDDVRDVPSKRRSRPSRNAIEPDDPTYSTADLLHMFADARAAHEDGDRAEARRLFERVIAARPNSELADTARKDLAALDAEERARAHRPTERRRARIAPRPQRPVYGPTRPPEQHAPSQRQERKQRSRRLVMLERQFIADVGDRIFFAKGSAELDARARAVLVAQADWLNAHPDIVITIEGHADDGTGLGPGPNNLSLARAEAVRQILIDEGVGDARIASVGRGMAQPVAMCSGARCAAQNRRVVTVISSEPIRIVGETEPRFSDGVRRRPADTSPNRRPAQ